MTTRPPGHSAAHGFDDPEAVAHYADGPRRMVPGYDSLLMMADLLLAEKVPDDGQVFVLGAGGGMELCTSPATIPTGA